jgi:WD40 repeat protein
LTGRPPFRAATNFDTLLQVVRQEPVPPRRANAQVPADLETICLMCLRKDPAKRYPSAAALAEDLRRWQSGEPIAARPVGRAERALKWARRRPSLAALLVVLALTTVGGVVAALVFTNQLRWERDRARDEQVNAETERGRAKQREQEARSNLYAARMLLAQSALKDNQVGQVLDLLRSLAPGKPGDRDLRGFEWHYLWNQCHAERVRLEHPGEIHHVVRMKDGRRILAVCTLRDPSPTRSFLICWDAQTGGPPSWKVNVAAKAVRALAVDPAGLHLISVEDEAVVHREIASGTEVRRTTVEESTGAPALSPDGQWLALQTSGRITIWDTQAGKKEREINISIDPNEHLFMGGDLPSGFLPFSPLMAFSPDGKRLALFRQVWAEQVSDFLKMNRQGSKPRAVSLPLSYVLVLDRERGKVLNRLVAPDAPRPQVFVKVDPATGLRTVLVDDPRSFKEQVVATALAFDPRGEHLTVGWEDGTIRTWTLLQDGNPVLLRGHSQAVRGLALSPDGRMMLASGGDDQAVRCWNLATGQEINLWRGHRSHVREVVFRPDGEQLASIGLDHTVRIWDVARVPGLEPLSSARGSMPQVAFAVDGRYLSCSPDSPAAEEIRPVSVWSLKSGPMQPRVTFEPIKLPKGEASPDRWIVTATRADENLLVQATARIPPHADGQPGDAHKQEPIRISLIRLDTGAVAETFSLPTIGLARKYSIALSPQGRLLASSQNDRTITVWDLDARKPVTTCKGMAHPVHRMTFSADGKRLISAGDDPAGQASEVLVWNALTGEKTATVPVPKGGVWNMQLRWDGRLLAVAHNVMLEEEGMILGQVLLWDMEQRKVVRTLPQRQYVAALAFSQDGQRLAVGGAGGVVRLFEVDSGQPVLAVPLPAGFIWSLAFSPDDHYLAAACVRSEDATRQDPRTTVLVLDALRIGRHQDVSVGWSRAAKQEAKGREARQAESTSHEVPHEQSSSGPRKPHVAPPRHRRLDRSPVRWSSCRGEAAGGWPVGRTPGFGLRGNGRPNPGPRDPLGYRTC